MGHFSMKISAPIGSILGGNQEKMLKHASQYWIPRAELTF